MERGFKNLIEPFKSKGVEPILEVARYQMERKVVLCLPVVLASHLTACTVAPPAVQPAEPESSGTLPFYYEADLVARPGRMAEADKLLVLEVEPEAAAAGPEADLGGAGQDVVAIRYVRGVEETVQWEGSGQGVAELTNAHGQLIYRVTEGGDAFKGLIPAGQYTLTVRAGSGAEARTLVLEPEPAAWSIRRDLFWLDERPPNRGGDALSYHYVHLKADDLRGKNLHGAYFYGVTFSDVTFKDLDFREATFELSRFERCHFDQIRFDVVKFETVQIRESVFHSTEMRRVRMEATGFVDNHVIGGRWSDVLLMGSWFTGNRFEGTELYDVRHNRGTWFSEDQRHLTPFGDNQGFESYYADIRVPQGRPRGRKR